MSRLERWSRLKRNVPQEQDVPSTSLPAAEPDTSVKEVEYGHSAPDAVQESDQLPERQPQEQAPEPGSLDHTLPDPATLEAGSDFSAFMAPGVSGPLRRQALKRLWATGNYNVRDGLDDYDADYKTLLKPMGSELASKLRRWTHKVEEAVDKSLDDAEPESASAKELAANEQTSEQTGALDEEHSTSGVENGSSMKGTHIDDQSDYLSGSKTKT